MVKRRQLKSHYFLAVIDLINREQYNNLSQDDRTKLFNAFRGFYQQVNKPNRDIERLEADLVDFLQKSAYL